MNAQTISVSHSTCVFVACPMLRQTQYHRSGGPSSAHVTVVQHTQDEAIVDALLMASVFLYFNAWVLSGACARLDVYGSI